MPALLTLARRVSSFISQPTKASLEIGRVSLPKDRRPGARWAAASMAALLCLGVSGARTVAAQITAHPNTFVSGTAALASPYIAVDSAGNIYSVQGTNPIHKGSFNASGVYTETVLTGTPTAAASGIAVDTSGNVFVSENSGTGVTDSHLIEKFVAGNGTAAPLYTGVAGPQLNGVAVDASGNVFSPADDGTLLSLAPIGTTGAYIITMPADGVASPTGIAVGASGTIFLSESDGTISQLVPVGAPLTSYTATALFTVTAPAAGVAVDAGGNVYGIGGSNTISELPQAASTPVNLRAASANPTGIATDASGNVYFSVGSTIGEVTTGQVLPTTAVNAASTAVAVSFFIDANTGSTALGTLSNANVLTQGVAGKDFTLATGSTCTGTPAASSTCTVNVIFNPLAPGLRLGAVSLLDSNSNLVATAYISGTGTGPQGVIYPGTQTTPISSQASGVVVDPTGTLFFGSQATVTKAVPSGNTFTQTTLGTFTSTSGLALDGVGNVYVSDEQAGQVYKESLAGGAYTQSTVGTIGTPEGVVADGAGNVFVISDTLNGSVYEYTPSGNAYTSTQIAANLGTLTGIGIDSAGELFVTDGGGGRVVKLTPGAGTYSQSVALAGLTDLHGITIDAAGDLYLGDFDNNQVLMAVPSGATYAVSAVFTGITQPSGVALDASGNVYASSTAGSGIVKLNVADTQTFNFPATAVGSVSTPQTGTLFNIGNSALTLPTPTSGNNPSLTAGYTLASSSTCPQLSSMSTPYVLAAAASCTEVVSFAPVAGTEGSTVTGQLVVTDNNLNASPSTTQVISLSGMVIAPPSIAAAFSPASVNVGSNSTLTFTVASPTGNPAGLTNVAFTATLPAGLVVATPTGVNTACGTSLTATAGGSGISLSGLSLAAGTSCAFTVNVTPTAGGSYTVTTGAVTSDQATGLTATAMLSVPQPTITTISPNNGLTVGLTPVTITGTNFLPNSAAANTVSVTFDGTAASVLTVTNTSITLLTPTHLSAAAVDVVITTINGSVTSTGGFTYGTPTLSLTPTLAPGTYGSAYSQNIQASGGLPPYSYTLKMGSGSLPPGLILTTNTAVPNTTPNSGTISGTPTSAGSYTFTITTTDANNYTFDQQYTLTINKAALSVTANNASFSYGGTYPTLTGTPTGLVNGDTAASVGLTFATTVPTTSTSTVGTYTISASLSDATAQNNYNLTVTTGTLTITKATTTVTTAPTASAITYGQALSASTLTGGSASSGATAVPGTFSWTTDTIKPNAGTPTYSVTFTPTDTTDYNTTTVNVTLTVNKATPTVTTPPTASDITFGQMLSASNLTGGAASSMGNPVSGTYTWTDGTIQPNAGTASYSVTFTPGDLANYNTRTVDVTLTVNKASTSITAAPTASPITFGQTLSASTLTGGTASVAGTFAWTNGGTVPAAGTASYSVTFTPTDSANYSTSTINVSITVSKATPTVTTPPTASPITYGQTLSASTFSGGTVTSGSTTVPGTFSWTNGNIAPNAGTPTYQATFTPTDTANYNATTVNVTLTVNKATPAIVRVPTASSIVYGATLSTSVLTAGSASTPGTFAWTNGTQIPPAGTASYSVTFTPTDVANYVSTTLNVSLIVSKATPTITTAPTASSITFGSMLSSSNLSGGVASVSGTFAWTNPSTTPAAGTASYSVTFTPSDTANYNTNIVFVSLTVGKATPTITALPTASAITYGQTLASSILTGGSASTAGAFGWTNSAIVPNGGTASYSVTFTPTDGTNFNTVTGSVSVVTNQAAQTLTFVQPASPVTYGDTTSISLTATATSNLTPTFTLVSGPGTVSGSTLTITGAGTIVVAADQAGNGNYLAATQMRRSIIVNVAPQTITFTQPASPITYGASSTVALTATGGGSQSPVTFSVLSGPGTIAGNILTITGAGTIVVAADQTGATNYGAASEVQRSIVIKMAPQTITFAQPATPVTYGSTTTIALSATGGATGNPVTFSVLSGPATLNGSTLTITTAGTIVVAADQTGNGNYSAATEVQRTIVIAKASTTLTGPPSQPVLVGTSVASSVPVSITAQYSGATLALPSGAIAYAILNASNTSVSSGSATVLNNAASIPVPSTLAPGQYTVSLNYQGDVNYAASTLNVSLLVGQFQPVIVWAQPAAIAYGTTLAGVLNAVAQDQSLTPAKTIPGTYTYLNGTTPITPVTVLPAGTYTLTVNFAPTDAATYRSATGSVSLTVNKVAPTVSLQASASSVLAQNAVSFIATVTSTGGFPTGSVTFLDGTATLGMATITNGTAVFTTSSLAVGPHSVTAQYTGDGNFTTQTTAATTVQVNDFNLVASGSTTVTAARGATANFSFTLAPSGTTTFPAAVNLTVSGLPAGATYTITPQTIAAGAGSTNVALTVNIPAQLSMLRTIEKFAPLTLALLILPFGGFMRRRAGKLPRLIATVLLLVGGAVGTATLTGCVGTISGAPPKAVQPQPLTYNIVVTGTSGVLSHSTTVTLVVQ